MTSTSHTTKETYQIAVIANGHIPSIMDYDWSGEESQWVISSFHTKQPSLVSAIARALEIDSKPSATSKCHVPNYEVIQIHQGFFAQIKDPSDLSRYLRHAQLVPVSKKTKSFTHGNISVSTNDNDPTMRFILNSFGAREELDAVRGHFRTATVSYNGAVVIIVIPWQYGNQH